MIPKEFETISEYICKQTRWTDGSIRHDRKEEIIRCKECKRWWGNHYHDNEDGKCPMDAWIDGDGFCSYGEREGE